MIDQILENLGIGGNVDISGEVDSNIEIGNPQLPESLSTSDSVDSGAFSSSEMSIGLSIDVDDSSSMLGDHSSGINGNMSELNSELSPMNEQDSVGAENTLMQPFNGEPASIGQSETSVMSDISSIDVDNLVNAPSVDNLNISHEELNNLHDKVEGMERSEHKKEISFGKKMCPTRHGCQGATDCDYCGGDYPG